MYVTSYPLISWSEFTPSVHMAMQAISDEALAFQREKQARLNQVEVVLLLRLHQVHILQENGQVPSDLSGALLFSSAELDKLKRRVHVGLSPWAASGLRSAPCDAKLFFRLQSIGCLRCRTGLLCLKTAVFRPVVSKLLSFFVLCLRS